MFATKTRKRKVLTLTVLSVLSFAAFVAIFAGATIPVVLQRNGIPACIGAHCVGTSSIVEVTIAITHNDQRYVNMGWLLSQWVQGRYYTPSCYINCNGITYTVDPTVSIMDCGRDFEQFKVFGSGGSAASCAIGGVAAYQSADIAQYIELSSSNTVTTTDTACPATVWTTNGGSIIAATITAGVKGATVTTTLEHKYTATGNSGSLGLVCIQDELAAGTSRVLYLEGQIGPDTLANTDTIDVTVTVART